MLYNVVNIIVLVVRIFTRWSLLVKRIIIDLEMSGKRFKVDLIRFIRDSYQIRSIILEYNSLVSNRTVIWIVCREKYRSLKVWKLEKWASDNYVNQRESVVARVNLFGGGRYTCRIFLLLLPSLFLLFYLDNNSEINSNQTYFIINRSTRQLYRFTNCCSRPFEWLHRSRNSILFIFFFKYTIQVKKFLKKSSTPSRGVLSHPLWRRESSNL